MIEENIPLAPMTTLCVGGIARFLMRVQSSEDLQKAVIFAREKNTPFFILGGGANTLVFDEGFPGLVIKMENKGIEVVSRDGYTEIIASAGEKWDDVVREAVARNLWGIENLSHIPGTVGGAVVQNIGAYGSEVESCVLWVEVFDGATNTLKKFSRDACAFGYRESIFKQNPALVVVRAAFNLEYITMPHVQYEEVKKYFVDHRNSLPTLADIREAIIAIRTDKLPPSFLGTAGSFFKNPVITNDAFRDLEKRFPDIKAHPLLSGGVKLSAAWLLDTIGEFNGVRRGDAGVYDKHALVLVNYGSATARSILDLAHEMKEFIKVKTGVILEEEVVMMK